MESLASRYCKVTRCQETQVANDQYRDRSLNWYYVEDGSSVIKGRFPAEQGALLLKALQLGMDGAEADESTADATAETHAEEITAVTPVEEITAETPAEASADCLGEIPRSHIENGPHFSAETSRRICCDSNVIPILTGKMGEALDIGRKSRTIPPSTFRFE